MECGNDARVPGFKRACKQLCLAKNAHMMGFFNERAYALYLALLYSRIRSLPVRARFARDRLRVVAYSARLHHMWWWLIENDDDCSLVIQVNEDG